MRYQDWDVLIFPGGPNSLVPLQEFRTQCFNLQDRAAGANTTNLSSTNSALTLDAGTAAPLVTCFIPALPENSAFSLSIHSWTQQNVFPVQTAAETDPVRYMWQVRVLVDGLPVTTVTYTPRVTWPQQIGYHDVSGAVDNHPAQLTFPPFHDSILNQTLWDAAEDLGRIKVELSTGYILDSDGMSPFFKMANHAIFAFQPAPLQLLQQCGIAWPSNVMPVVSARQRTMPRGMIVSQASSVSVPDTFAHKRRASSASISDGHSGSSKSASGYPEGLTSAYNSSIGMQSTVPSVMFSDETNRRMEVRLSSDQLEKLIKAISQSSASEGSMLPPPTPNKKSAEQVPPNTPSDTTIDSNNGKVQFAENSNRRGGNVSDVSKHPGCNAFPSCTTEDLEGHVLHSSPSNPSSYVKGRKEGSSPTMQRDFLSTVMDGSTLPPATPMLLSSSPADGTGRKRTRAALKSLTINDESPEKMNISIKPQRKVSRIASASSDKENMVVD